MQLDSLLTLLREGNKIVLIPIIGALALASGTLLEKVSLMQKKVNIKLYQTIIFLATVLVMTPFVFFFWKITPGAYTVKSILIFALVILFSLLANFFTFYSMKWEKLSKLEPAKITEPIFVILLAIIMSYFFTDGLYERNLKVIIPAIIAGVALIFSHIKKHHLTFNKYFLAALLGSLFFAIELIISRLILDFYSPITFYYIRCASIFLISIAMFRPKFFSNLDGKATLGIFATGAFWFIYRVAVYYGYMSLGIISTTLITMLSPVFVYAFAKIFLKEKLRWKNIIASIIIIACVVYASYTSMIQNFILSLF